MLLSLSDAVSHTMGPTVSGAASCPVTRDMAAQWYCLLCYMFADTKDACVLLALLSCRRFGHLEVVVANAGILGQMQVGQGP